MKCIIFDADHTLYDLPSVESAEEKKFIFLQEKTGIDADKLRDKWRLVVRDILEKGIRYYEKRNREYSAKETLLYFGLDEHKAKILSEKAVEVFWKEIVKTLKFYPETKDIIKSLKEKHRLCVASDEFRKSLEMKLDRIFGEWKDYFEFLVTADDTKELKPSKRFCEIPLEKFGVEPSQAVFIGDSWERELAVAKEMGLKTVLVNERREGEPDYWVKDIREITNINL